MRLGLGITCLLWSTLLQAGEVEVLETQFRQLGGQWTVSATLRHDDTGWEHYADAWRVVNESGDVLGTRVLYHPHEHEQPFTRSLAGIRIPNNVTVVFVEAHDKVHGWSGQRIRVNLATTQGPAYSIERH